MKQAVLVAVLALACGTGARADTIPTIAAELEAGAGDPLSPIEATQLATNIWNAHENTPYALVEADSLELSIDSVLRALADGLAIAEIQSTIAIDDRVSLQLSVGGVVIQPGDVLYFGEVPLGQGSSNFAVISTPAANLPEPSILALVLCGLLILVAAKLARAILA